MKTFSWNGETPARGIVILRACDFFRFLAILIQLNPLFAMSLLANIEKVINSEPGFQGEGPRYFVRSRRAAQRCRALLRAHEKGPSP